MDYDERKAARERGKQGFYGALGGCVMLPLNILVVLAIIGLIYLAVTGNL